MLCIIKLVSKCGFTVVPGATVAVMLQGGTVSEGNGGSSDAAGVSELVHVPGDAEQDP